MMTFIFQPNWYELINGFKDEKDRLDLYDIIVQYGCNGKYEVSNAMMENIFNTMIKPSMDITRQNYERKSQNGKVNGRPKKFNEEDIAVLAKEGLTAIEIGERLGISKETVYHSKGWKSRKDL